MPKTGIELDREREEKEKGEVIDLLDEQVEIERKLVNLYEVTEGDIKSSAVRHLLRMIQLDSKKHIETCQLVVKVLRGEDCLKEEKEEILEGLQRHIKLEKDAVNTANKILKNVWVRETEGLKWLIKKWRDDETAHQKALKKLVGKRFFRLSPFDLAAQLRSIDELEERYKKYERKMR